jgi:hypothetical protein
MGSLKDKNCKTKPDLLSHRGRIRGWGLKSKIKHG